MITRRYMMEILKRIIDRICALVNLLCICAVIWVVDPSFQNFIDNAFPLFRFFAITALITAVINFALFKKFTIWNK